MPPPRPGADDSNGSSPYLGLEASVGDAHADTVPRLPHLPNDDAVEAARDDGIPAFQDFLRAQRLQPLAPASQVPASQRQSMAVGGLESTREFIDALPVGLDPPGR